MVSGWCPCVPLGRRESPPPQQNTNRNNSSRRGPFTISAATDRAEMVQMFYYENRGKCCKKLLRYNGYPNKVRNHTHTHTHIWLLKKNKEKKIVQLSLNCCIFNKTPFTSVDFSLFVKVPCFYSLDGKIGN